MSVCSALRAPGGTQRWVHGGTQVSTLHRALREVPLIAMLYLIYAGGRILASHHTGEAFHHAEQVWSLERAIGLPSEHSLQQLALNWTWLIKALGAYYARVHFPVTIAVLIWLFVRRPEAYPWFRWTLALLTGFGLVGHVLYPLAPPRMLTDHGMVDTAKTYGDSVYGQVGTGLANQFAAMPSLHVGWAVLIAVALITTLRSKWRWLAIVHPVITIVVVVITGNHYWLDGIIACLLLLLALTLTRSLRPAAVHSAEIERPMVLGRVAAQARAHAWPLVRFVVVGGAATLFSSVLFLLLVDATSANVANAVAVVASTLLANEAHRWWTFRSHAGGVVSRVAAAGTVVLAYLITSGAQLLLAAVDQTPSTDAELVVMLVATATAGLLRYALLGSRIFPAAPASPYEDSADGLLAGGGFLGGGGFLAGEGVTVGDTVPAEWSQGIGSPVSTEPSTPSTATAATSRG